MEPRSSQSSHDSAQDVGNRAVECPTRSSTTSSRIERLPRNVGLLLLASGMITGMLPAPRGPFDMSLMITGGFVRWPRGLRAVQGWKLFEYLDAGQWGERVEGLESDFVLLGHTHIQDMRRFGRVTVVNPGSVGLNRDGSGKACYAVYDDQGMTLKRVEYDVDRTVAALHASPLPQTVVCKLEFILRPQDQE